MKPKILTLAGCILLAVASLTSCGAQFDAAKALEGGSKVIQAATLSDAQIKAYVQEYVAYSDKQNKVLPESSPYTVRLRKLTKGLTQIDADTPLNFKVYDTKEANAFACADGSVRVYSYLMDLMTDDELMGVIGHEIGHVAMKHSKKAFKTALITSAVTDGIASSGGVVAALSSSQLGAIGESLVNASFSRKQETEADDFGYAFLKASGRNPWVMASSFEKLLNLEKSSGSKNGNNAVNQLFSSHPDMESRIARIEEKATKDGFKKP